MTSTIPNYALDLRDRCTSSMCERSLSKVRLLRNEICLNNRLHRNKQCKHSKGGFYRGNNVNTLQNIHCAQNYRVHMFNHTNTYTNQTPPKQFRLIKCLSSRVLKVRKYISNVHKIVGGHLQCINNHYAMFGYKGMKTV